MNSWEVGSGVPKPERLDDIAKALQVPLDWLLGETDATPWEPTGRSAAPDQDWTSLPAYSGQGPVGIDTLQAPWMRLRQAWLYQNGISLDRSLLVQVQGDAMEPTLRSGDTVLVDAKIRQPDGMALVRVGRSIGVRRLHPSGGKAIAVSGDNPAYPPFQAEEGEEFEVLGRIAYILRRV